MQKNDPEIIDIPSLGMWLFLASEAMFFIAMLGAFFVLESTGQQHALFAKSSAMLSDAIGIFAAILLLVSSIVIWRPTKYSGWAAVGIAILFLLLQCGQQAALMLHKTMVYRNADKVLIADNIDSGVREKPMPDRADVHDMTAGDFASCAVNTSWIYPSQDQILETVNYGPSRNNFFASYFLMSAAHGIHLVAGLFALVWFLLFRRGKIPAAVQNYWHFVNLVGIFGLAAVYFV